MDKSKALNFLIKKNQGALENCLSQHTVFVKSNAENEMHH